MKSFTLRSGSDPFIVEGHVLPMGGDLLVMLTGGESHIGAVAMAEPRPSLRDPVHISSTASVFTYTGHKEDAIAKEIAELLAKETNRKVVVVAGLRWKDLGSEEIPRVIKSCRVLAGMIVQRMGET